MSNKTSGNLRTRARRLAAHPARNWLIGGVALYAVLGFLVAPWLVKKYAIEATRDYLGADLRLEKVAINPFVLSLRVSGLELDDPDGARNAEIAEIFANFQLSSLFRLAYTFDELRITDPELFVARNPAGQLNLAYLAAEPDSANTTPEESETDVTPLMIFNFALQNCAINWKDEVPVDTVETRFGPINVDISELNTLPSRSGQQEVLITTETEGTLSWSGDLQLNPFKSAAHASLKGSPFPLASAYIKHQLGFDIVEGNADVDLDYAIETTDDGSLKAQVNNFNLALHDVAVNTFPVPGAGDQPAEVLRLPDLALAEGTVAWPERTATVASLTIDDALVSLVRDELGGLNVVRGSNEPAQNNTDETASPAAEENWSLSLASLAINRLAVDLEDHSVTPVATIGFEDVNLGMTGLDNAPGSLFPATLDLSARTGGTLSFAGTIAVLPDVIVELDTTFNDVALAVTHPYIKPLADVHLDSGSLNVDGKLLHNVDDPFSFNGDLEINDFSISETEIGTRLGSWTALRVQNLAVSVAEQNVAVSEILFEQPYGDIVIGEDGSLNLGRLEKGATVLDEESTTEADATAEDEEAAQEEPFAITIGRVVFSDSSADFADQSLPLPFSAKIEQLNGNLTTISTDSDEPAAVEMEGKVDEFGLVRISGTVTPLDPALNTDLLVAFQNVEMPKFTAYTIPFAGREIASGNLDLDLGYKVTDRHLVGENKIVMRNLELGEKVEHPGAMSLPLGLAIALLKDSEGKIDIDLPVSGDVDDPEFSYGGVVLKALGNLIVKIVASPFALLGKLVGVEANDLEQLNFFAGRADLTPPEQEKVAKLAEALALRPELALELAGPFDAESDGLALRTAKLQDLIDDRMSGLEATEGEESMFDQQQKAVLEQLLSEQQSSEVLEALRAAHTHTADEEGAEPVFDELAYATALKEQLIALQDLSDAELTALAMERANNTRNELLQLDPTLDQRIKLVDVEETEIDEGESIPMSIAISATAETRE